MQSLTQQDIDNLVESASFHHHDNKVSVCFLKVKGIDFYVTGESGVLDRNKFNKEIGEQYALENAKNKLWQLQAYMLVSQEVATENLKE